MNLFFYKSPNLNHYAMRYLSTNVVNWWPILNSKFKILMSTLYDFLGVSRTATPQEIKKAYHKAAIKYHPDKQVNPSEETTSMFLKIVDAFAVLSNQNLRSEYDKELELKEATEELQSEISKSRQDLIDQLNLREAEAQRGDPLQPYRDDLKAALKQMAPKSDSRTFEEYERIIISSLLRSSS